MTPPPVLIVHAPGTNRDGDAADAVRAAGGDPRIVLVEDLRRGEARFADHAALVLPGGFSHGDALGAGSRLALELRAWFADELAAFVAAGRPVLGICNGFQALVKAGLLPGPRLDDRPRTVTLTANRHGRFECRWVRLRVEPCRSGWLASLAGRVIDCPVAHGEGRLAAAGDEVVSALETERLVAFRYVDAEGRPAGGRHPDNPNGSVADVAGICDDTGVVVGLMPHPEDHIVSSQTPHPRRQRLGLAVFEALVEAAR